MTTINEMPVSLARNGAVNGIVISEVLKRAGRPASPHIIFESQQDVRICRGKIAKNGTFRRNCDRLYA